MIMIIYTVYIMNFILFALFVFASFIYNKYLGIVSLIIFILYFYNKKEYMTNSYKYTAVIVEPRQHAALEYVLNNYNEHLSNEWQFILYHGNKNKEYSEKICNKIFKPGRMTFMNLNVDNLTIDDYNKLLYSKSFWESIPTEIILIFQTDSIICSKHKDLINKFLKYDYVGAPWVNGGVGNGGLSLRNKSKMIEILNQCSIPNMNEDGYFSGGCDGIVINKPSYEEAKTFSIETVTNDKTFGIHKAYNYLNIDDISEWCPEINKLKELNQ